MPIDWDADMNDSGDEGQSAKNFWRGDMFDSREAWKVRVSSA
jgi:hypothetical protein